MAALSKSKLKTVNLCLVACVSGNKSETIEGALQGLFQFSVFFCLKCKMWFTAFMIVAKKPCQHLLCLRGWHAILALNPPSVLARRGRTSII